MSLRGFRRDGNGHAYNENVNSNWNTKAPSGDKYGSNGGGKDPYGPNGSWVNGDASKPNEKTVTGNRADNAPINPNRTRHLDDARLDEPYGKQWSTSGTGPDDASHVGAEDTESPVASNVPMHMDGPLPMPSDVHTPDYGTDDSDYADDDGSMEPGDVPNPGSHYASHGAPVAHESGGHGTPDDNAGTVSPTAPHEDGGHEAQDGGSGSPGHGDEGNPDKTKGSPKHSPRRSSPDDRSKASPWRSRPINGAPANSESSNDGRPHGEGNEKTQSENPFRERDDGKQENRKYPVNHDGTDGHGANSGDGNRNGGGRNRNRNRNASSGRARHSGRRGGKPNKEKKTGLVERAKQGVRNRVTNTKDAIKNAPKNMANNAKNAIKDRALSGVHEVQDKVQRAGNQIKNAAKAVQRWVKGFAIAVKSLFSPAGIIATLVVLSIIAILGLVQTVGPSVIDCDVLGDNTSSQNSSSNGGSSSGAGAGDFKGEVATKVFDFLTNEMGFSGAGAAGALAVAYRESNFRLDAHNVGGGVAGIFQWSGYSNSVNGSRITSEGSIKPGDPSTLTLENQLKLLRYELNGGYSKVKTTVGKATDPVQAAKDWSLLYEGVALSDGQSKISEISDWAVQACDAHNCHSIQADEAKLGSGESVKTGGSSVADNLKEVFCGAKAEVSNKNGGVSGAVGGAKDCTGNNGGCDYGWLCNAMGVCKDGDYGVIPAPFGYQCVWYAWSRAAMVYKDSFRKSWDTVQGDGGAIWANAKGRPGWTVSDTPQAGDIISGSGGSFSGGGAYGHVAFVEKVENTPSGWRIYISEGNFGGSADWHGYNTRWLEKSNAGNVHFVRNDAWHATKS